MISMSYSCTTCGLQSGVLRDAQEHANQTSHHVSIHGFITPSQEYLDRQPPNIEEAQRRRAFEREVLRRAKEKGLVRK